MEGSEDQRSPEGGAAARGARPLPVDEEGEGYQPGEGQDRTVEGGLGQDQEEGRRRGEDVGVATWAQEVARPSARCAYSVTSSPDSAARYAAWMRAMRETCSSGSGASTWPFTARRK